MSINSPFPMPKLHNLSSLHASKQTFLTPFIMLPKPFLFPALLIHSSYSHLKAAAISFPSQPGVSAFSSPESSNETSKIPNQLPYAGTNPYCSASIIWTGFNNLDSHFQRDCRAATDKFEDFVASCPNPNTRYEFLDPRTQPMQRLPKMETPRRYVSRGL